MGVYQLKYVWELVLIMKSHFPSRRLKLKWFPGQRRLWKRYMIWGTTIENIWSSNFELFFLHNFFNHTGPMHHARWMSKVIYLLKVWMFPGQFKLTQREEQCLLRYMIVKYWIETSLPISTPRNEQELLKTLHAYTITDEAVSKATLRKFIWENWFSSLVFEGRASAT